MNPNALAFTALANEYCVALENAREHTPAEFTAKMTRLLPRIYIAASDLRPDDDLVALNEDDDEDAWLDQALEEDYYDSVRRGIEDLLGPDDTYLDVFEQDMKYSDTPIGASLSEGLADVFQPLYNYLATVRDATDEVVNMAIRAVADEFHLYWSQKLVNVMRPLNALRNLHRDEEE